MEVLKCFENTEVNLFDACFSMKSIGMRMNSVSGFFCPSHDMTTVKYHCIFNIFVLSRFMFGGC